MNMLAFIAGACFFGGALLVLHSVPSLRRASLRTRLEPYHAPMAMHPALGGDGRPVVRTLLGPGAIAVGDAVARIVGVRSALDDRLERIGSELDPTSFRLRQVGAGAAALAAAATIALLVRPPAVVAASAVVALPLLVMLVLEQEIVRRSDERRHHLLAELPVVAEQLGMLLSAGFSLSGAMQRLATRGRGVCGDDLRRVVRRMGQGLPEIDALREWAQVAEVPALTRLVGILALNRQGGDLGRLVAEEARSMRREAHRERLEAIERRSQQVWIPVTVAALVPGSIFIAIPFLDALQTFSRT